MGPQGLFDNRARSFRDVGNSGDDSVAGGTVTIGADASVEAVYGLSVRLRSRSSVSSVSAWALTRGFGTTLGEANDTPNIPNFDNAVAPLRALTCAGGTNVTLNPMNDAEPTRLAPGSYGPVKVERGRTLELEAGGTYHFEELQVEPGGKVVAIPGGRTRVYVCGKMMLKGDVEAAAGQLLLATLQTGTVHVETDVTATLIAPNGKLEVHPGKIIVGSLIAKSVELHQDAVVRVVGFPAPWIE